jgi:hypothetical protein
MKKNILKKRQTREPPKNNFDSPWRYFMKMKLAGPKKLKKQGVIWNIWLRMTFEMKYNEKK